MCKVSLQRALIGVLSRELVYTQPRLGMKAGNVIPTILAHNIYSPQIGKDALRDTSHSRTPSFDAGRVINKAYASCRTKIRKLHLFIRSMQGKDKVV